jgi:hypothetical protein
MLKYFNVTDHPVQQSGVAVVSLPIVFSMNLSGITGIVLMETAAKTRLFRNGVG